MASGRFRFDRFILDEGERQLRLDGAPVDLNARYLDALALLVREQGRLVSKDRFHEEVWRGIPVTDEALTQCIRTLRKRLGDEAASPRFIETVPKHGYRFLAPVEAVDMSVEGAAAQVEAAGEPADLRHPKRLHLWLGGTAGAACAGLVGGLFYGFAASPQAPGAASAVLVLMCVTMLVAISGGAGVSFGIAAAWSRAGWKGHWSLLGGGLGGLIVGAIVKLIGLDAFNLLFGQSPGDITGAAEGALLGVLIGLAAWLSVPRESLRLGVMTGGLFGAAAGIAIIMLGGRLLGGSLDLLASHFPNSRLRMDQIGNMLGDRQFGFTAQMVSGALEGALFGGCLVGGMILAARNLPKR